MARIQNNMYACIYVCMYVCIFFIFYFKNIFMYICMYGSVCMTTSTTPIILKVLAGLSPVLSGV